MKLTAFILLLLSVWVAYAQTPSYPAAHPYSTQSEENFTPCRDTISFLKIKRYYDIGVILPSWLPIIDKNYVAVLEGTVTYNRTNGTDGPHVSHEDLPFYHYSHDFDFDVVPDVTEDNRFTNLLPYRIYKTKDGYDTILQNYIGCEWETGLGINNRINPLRHDCDDGRSAGFYSAGHERRDVIWNWPSPADWVHVEGHYVWDRGHPPARAEIHPPRFVAIKRALPAQIMIGDSSLKFATRIDLFASGDGGALLNNRYNSKPFVQRVNMSGKDYELTVKMNIPRPSPNAVLRYQVVRRKGDTFSYDITVTLKEDSGTAHLFIPWKTLNANDLEVLARTVYLFWDEGRGIASEQPVDIYKVKLTNLHFRYLGDKLSKAEPRLFANVGSDWIFVNDFFGTDNAILTKGLGKTRKKNWILANEFTICVPRGQTFRVYMSGWEVDGVDQLAGDIIDPHSLCDRKTKRYLKDKLFSITHMLFRGCLDDQYGEISQLHSYDKLGRTNHFNNSPQEGMNEDPCPGSKYPLKDRYFLSYTIEKIN
jgi:hypothetical protein